MSEINVTGNVGDVVKLNYKGSTLELKLDADRVIPDVVESVLLAIKEDPNAILVCANTLYRPNVSGEITVRSLLNKLKEQIYLKIDSYAERASKTERHDKKTKTAPEQAPIEDAKSVPEQTEEKAPATFPEQVVEEKPAPEEKSATKKSSPTTKKTSSTTAKKTTK